MTDNFLPFESNSKSSAAPKRQVYTVGDLTKEIRSNLESSYPEIWVEGELSNSRRWRTGHLYFTLKDGTAQLKGVMFRSSAQHLKFDPDDGLHVLARGRLSVYEPKGEYQLVAEQLEPHGVGARQLAFDQLRRKLEKEGLFDQAKKKPLPKLPRKIGVVTSLDGAALRDVLTVIGRRFPTAHIVISPTLVQGEEAARQIVSAFDLLTTIPNIDVVILTRGGGSAEDLWAFNDESLARTISDSSIPVISAVGHETDTTISDLVADIRAPTPSSAAEIVVAQHNELREQIDNIRGHLNTVMAHQIEKRNSVLDAVRHRPGIAGFLTRLALQGRHVDDLSYRLVHNALKVMGTHQRSHTALKHRLDALDLRRQLPRIRQRLTKASEAINRTYANRQLEQRAALDTSVAKLESLSPLGVLARGYSVCWNEKRTTILRSANEVAVGDNVKVKLHEGELSCQVKEG